jgi:hypothetical protein
VRTAAAEEVGRVVSGYLKTSTAATMFDERQLQLIPDIGNAEAEEKKRIEARETLIGFVHLSTRPSILPYSMKNGFTLTKEEVDRHVIYGYRMEGEAQQKEEGKEDGGGGG